MSFTEPNTRDSIDQLTTLCLRQQRDISVISSVPSYLILSECIYMYRLKSQHDERSFPTYSVSITRILKMVIMLKPSASTPSKVLSSLTLINQCGSKLVACTATPRKKNSSIFTAKDIPSPTSGFERLSSRAYDCFCS
jgi:hypothetical protein